MTVSGGPFQTMLTYSYPDIKAAQLFFVFFVFVYFFQESDIVRTYTPSDLCYDMSSQLAVAGKNSCRKAKAPQDACILYLSYALSWRAATPGDRSTVGA